MCHYKCSNVHGKIQKGNEKKEARDTENTKEKVRSSAIEIIKNKGL
jgi:malate/lactate dehydrogenase